jgi:ATP-binding cassette, subfamily B, bacterial
LVLPPPYVIINPMNPAVTPSETIDWSVYAWPSHKLDDALVHLAAQTKFTVPPAQPSELAPPHATTDTDISAWVLTAADQLGLLAEAVHTPYAEVESFIRRASPALYQLSCPLPHAEATPHYLLALKARRGRVALLCPDLTQKWLSVAQIRAGWCYEQEVALLPVLGGLWDELGLRREARVGANTAVAQTHLAQTPIGHCWLFYPPPYAPLRHQLLASGLLSFLFLIIFFNISQQLVTIGGWAIIGNGALTGWFDQAQISAWVLIMLTALLCQAFTYQLQGPLATHTLRFIKSRLLYGSLQIDPDEIRHQGSGQFFGRVLESDMVQNYLVGGALLALPFSIMLVLAGVILSFGAGGMIHVLFLLAWTAIALYIGWLRLWHGGKGMDIYRQMTNDLVENMIGHRTRLAQENRSRWHDAEDKSLAEYNTMTRYFDENGIYLDVLVPRGWLVLGMLGLAYPFVMMTASVEKLAIAVGGILLAYMAFESLAQTMKFLAQSVVSWRQIAPLLAAAQKQPTAVSSAHQLPPAQTPPPPDNHRQPLLMMRDVTFRYQERSQAILQNCDLTIMHGDQLLLEGPSGGGKSTLAAILSGLRQPQAGLMLLWGFDTHTIGDTLWRQRIVTAPQFQENHIFTDTFAFNLLMGRGWPATPADLEDATQLCHELGLGPLLARMPHGLHQMIGEGGWQLSFGERSRLYIARALLQNADFVILDESFGALDPESLKQAMQCVLRWTNTLMVIAHP